MTKIEFLLYVSFALHIVHFWVHKSHFDHITLLWESLSNTAKALHAIMNRIEEKEDA